MRTIPSRNILNFLAAIIFAVAATLNGVMAYESEPFYWAVCAFNALASLGLFVFGCITSEPQEDEEETDG